MTLPHERKIIVDEHEYSYVLKQSERPRRTGDSPGRMRLVIALGSGKIVTTEFRSKAWTADHESGERSAPPHKAGFLPSDVAAVIRALSFHAGVLPAAFELPAWRRVEMKNRRRQPEEKPLPSRRSIGEHLNIDDLRALVSEAPALSTDYRRALTHTTSCVTCRDEVERERAANPGVPSEHVEPLASGR